MDIVGVDGGGAGYGNFLCGVLDGVGFFGIKASREDLAFADFDIEVGGEALAAEAVGADGEFVGGGEGFVFAADLFCVLCVCVCE